MVSNDKTHLLYILLTTKCPIKCDFCMTTALHGKRDLLLNNTACESLDRLVLGARKVCFSGEGETLMAWRQVLDIMSRPGSGRTFEIITSAFWPFDPLDRFLYKVAAICRKNADLCNIRVSVDEFHDKKLKHHNISALLSRFMKESEDDPLTLGFRSITGQEEYVRSKFDLISEELGIGISWNVEDPLRHRFMLGNHEFLVEYKNVVMPGLAGIKDTCPLDRYIEVLEERYERPFTLGSLEYTADKPGFDITVNPNGDVVFYGMESTIVGNINRSIVDYDVISDCFDESRLCQLLYQIPFRSVLKSLRNSEKLRDLVAKVNNPYWIVRYAEELFPGEIEKCLLLDNRQSRRDRRDSKQMAAH